MIHSECSRQKKQSLSASPPPHASRRMILVEKQRDGTLSETVIFLSLVPRLDRQLSKLSERHASTALSFSSPWPLLL